MSRSTYPKQFQDFLGTGESLIQQTVRRILKLCPVENIYIVTNEAYKPLCLEQLPQLKENQILCEPCMRNTAPCIAYAAFKIKAINPNANILVAPSDHLIMKEDEFVIVVNEAMNYTSNHDALVTFGIEPSRPDTGYGYIQYEAHDDPTVSKVVNFTEKPDLPTAKSFLESGDYSWNSGMFIWNVAAIIKAIETHLPDIYNIFTQKEQVYNSDQEQAFINEVYPTCENVSIDYGIMEKADNVFVINADIGWSDLGTWGSVYTHLSHDNEGNAIVGNNVMVYGSKNCMIHVPDNKLWVIQGLDDHIVVESGNATLICRKADEQMIKQFVADIRDRKGPDYV